MEEIKKELTLREKMKAHRKEIALGVAGGVLFVGGMLLYKKFGVGNSVNCNIENILIQAENPEVTVVEDVMDKIINVFPVDGHIRKLPDGWKASEAQILAALGYGIELADNETWVNPYVKRTAS